MDAQFLKGCTDAQELKSLDRSMGQIAFVGRSNVGKSSLINCLCARKNLARSSKTPGRTAMINVFTLNNTVYLIDLPGYGFAQAAKHERETWEGLMHGYMEYARTRQDLVLFLVDIRREILEEDIELLEDLKGIFAETKLVLTKSDKLSANQIRKAVLNWEKMGWQEIFVVTSQNQASIRDLRDWVLLPRKTL